jgi:putative tryptophan/tyrosine transport system substrate-binding protein
MRFLLSALAWAILGLTVDIGAASAQQSDRVYKIGWLSLARPGWVYPPIETWPGAIGGFWDALRDKGFVVGKNLVVDLRHGNGDMARLAQEAESLAASNVDLIVTRGGAATAAAMQATKHIPIVFLEVGDPVGRGMVASLAKPGGNVTGIAVQVTGPKMYQLIRDIAPKVRRVGRLNYGPARANSLNQDRAQEYQATQDAINKTAAAAVGLEDIYFPVNSRDEIEPKLAEFAKGGDAALIIVSDITISLWSEYILATALQHRLVTACNDIGWARAGCAISYADDNYARLRRGAVMVDKVLKGTKPADIPVEQPTVFKLIVNARTMKALDLTVPPMLLTLADEVIE